MKKIYLVLLSGLFIFPNLNAQDLVPADITNFPAKKWRIKKIGGSHGGDREMFSLSPSYFTKTSKDQLSYNYNDVDFTEEEVDAMSCDNPNYRASVVLESPSSFLNIRTDVYIITDRVDMVHYKRIDDPNSSLDFDATSNEVGFELAVQKEQFLGQSRWKIFGGAGMNTGVSFGNKVCVSGYNVDPYDNFASTTARTNNTSTNTTNSNFVADEYFEDCFDQKGAIHQRVYLEGGIGVHFGKSRAFEMDFSIRKGVGYRYFVGSETQGTRLEGAAFSFYYNLPVN